MAPGVGSLPKAAPAADSRAADPRPGPADERVDVVARLEPYLATLPPRTLRVLKLALWALELMPFPWRFSRASFEARHEFLGRLDRSTSSLRRDLLLLLKVLVGVAYGSDEQVQRAVGYEAACRIADDGPAAGTGAGPVRPVAASPTRPVGASPTRPVGASPAQPVGASPTRPVGASPAQPVAAAASNASIPPTPLGDLEPPAAVEECDVVVVGSGAGGAVAATALAEAGLDVIVLDAGGYMDRHSYPDEPLAALAALYRDGGLTVAEGRPSIPTPVGRAVGGTTVINSGTALRTPEPVLASWARECGIDWAPQLDPDYTEAEEMLAVEPVDPERMGRNGQLLREGAEALGASHAPLRRNAGRCVQCSSCPGGCRIDAKRAMHVSYLPRAVAAGARVRAGVEAKGIVFDGDRASAVECVAGRADPANRRTRAYSVRARRAIVLAAGAFGTPELLLRSGFRSASDQLGRNLRIHPACWVGARFAEQVRGWEGVMQSYAVDEWHGMGLLLEATFTPLAFGGQWLPGTGREHQNRLLAFEHVASTGVHLSDRSAGRVRLAGNGALRIAYRLSRDDGDRLSFGIARAAELLYAAGATEVYPQISGLPTIPRNRIAELEAAPPPRSALRLEAFHPMGTARMHADTRQGVTAPDGAVHGAGGLYVADGSLMPTSIGVNPMLTIVAMAARIGRGLADRLA